jgi:hypothetical protein
MHGATVRSNGAPRKPGAPLPANQRWPGRYRCPTAPDR